MIQYTVETVEQEPILTRIYFDNQKLIDGIESLGCRQYRLWAQDYHTEELLIDSWICTGEELKQAHGIAKLSKGMTIAEAIKQIHEAKAQAARAQVDVQAKAAAAKNVEWWNDEEFEHYSKGLYGVTWVQMHDGVYGPVDLPPPGNKKLKVPVGGAGKSITVNDVSLTPQMFMTLQQDIESWFFEKDHTKKKFSPCDFVILPGKKVSPHHWIRLRFSEVLAARHVDAVIREYIAKKEAKKSADKEPQQTLFDLWKKLTEQQNAEKIAAMEEAVNAAMNDADEEDVPW